MFAGTGSFSTKKRTVRAPRCADKAPAPQTQSGFRSLLMEAMNEHRKEYLSLRAKHKQRTPTIYSREGTTRGDDAHSVPTDHAKKTVAQETLKTRQDNGDKLNVNGVEELSQPDGNGWKDRNVVAHGVVNINKACEEKRRPAVNNGSADLDKAEQATTPRPPFSRATSATKSGSKTRRPPSILRGKSYHGRGQSFRTSRQAGPDPSGLDVWWLHDGAATTRSKENPSRVNNSQDIDLDFFNNLHYLIVDNDDLDGDVIGGKNNFLILADNKKNLKKSPEDDDRAAGSSIRKREVGLQRLRKTFTERKQLVGQATEDAPHGDSCRSDCPNQPKTADERNLGSHNFLQEASRQKEIEAQPRIDAPHYRSPRRHAVSSPKTKAENKWLRSKLKRPEQSQLRSSPVSTNGVISGTVVPIDDQSPRKPSRRQQRETTVTRTETETPRAKRTSSAELIPQLPVLLRSSRAMRRANSAGIPDDRPVSPSSEQARHGLAASRSRTRVAQRVRFAPRHREDRQTPKLQDLLSKHSKQEGETSRARHRKSYATPHALSKEDKRDSGEQPVHKENALHNTGSHVEELKLPSAKEKSSSSLKFPKDVSTLRVRSKSPAYNYRPTRRSSPLISPMFGPQHSPVTVSAPLMCSEKSPPKNRKTKVSNSPAERPKKGKLIRTSPKYDSFLDTPLECRGRKFKKKDIPEKWSAKNGAGKKSTKSSDRGQSLSSIMVQNIKNNTATATSQVKHSPRTQTNTETPSGACDQKGKKSLTYQGDKCQSPLKQNEKDTTKSTITKIENTSPNRKIADQTHTQPPNRVQANKSKQKQQEIASRFIRGLSQKRKKERDIGKQNLTGGLVTGGGKGKNSGASRVNKSLVTFPDMTNDLCGWDRGEPGQDLDHADLCVPGAGERCSFAARANSASQGEGRRSPSEHQDKQRASLEAKARKTRARSQRHTHRTGRASRKVMDQYQSSTSSTTLERQTKQRSQHDHLLPCNDSCEMVQSRHNLGNNLHQLQKTAEVKTSREQAENRHGLKQKTTMQLACKILESSNEMAARIVELGEDIEMLQAEVDKVGDAKFWREPVKDVKKGDRQDWIPTIKDYLKLVVFMGLQFLAQCLFVMK
ncbi:hypothetical protein EGW08_005860 [Elysia chlorotica]|uniref:Uncharacterized protein n=1 Tax=Elysia chlorotica TaxID=188477 RepID=A0A3S1BED8_ELYCH|nr:hypothetical protein EGW08_005860 [Elysia chlorotica]